MPWSGPLGVARAIATPTCAVALAALKEPGQDKTRQHRAAEQGERPLLPEAAHTVGDVGEVSVAQVGRRMIDALGSVVNIPGRSRQLLVQLVRRGVHRAGDAGELTRAGFLLLLGELRRALLELRCAVFQGLLGTPG